MAEITLEIPEAKLDFFLELIKRLGFEAKINDLSVPDAHKDLVRNRKNTAQKEDFVLWE